MAGCCTLRPCMPLTSATSRMALLCIAQLAFVSAASATPWPTVHLRTGPVHTAQGPRRGHQNGRSLAEAPRHSLQHETWGPGRRGGKQVLVSLHLNASQGEMDAVIGRIEDAGGHVDHYLPDQTLLCICTEDTARDIELLPSVAWVGDYLPKYKQSPSWQPLLSALKDNDIDRVEALLSSDSNSSSCGHYVNVSDRVPIVVSFPPLAHATEALRHSDNYRSTSNSSEPWSSAGTSDGEPYDPAFAAVSEWPQALKQRFGFSMGVENVVHHRVFVWTPLHLLSDVLTWLADHPIVHWMAPRYAQCERNYYATAIISDGDANIGKSPQPWTKETHPLWAAGLRGQNQIVGCGDSGIDLKSCFFSDPSVTLSLKQNIYTNINWFENPDHRKIRFYRLYADSAGKNTQLPDVLDKGGHGTHVAGSLVGESLGDNAEFNGMAPSAKIAFHDLGNAQATRGIQTPYDLQTGYFRWSYLYGARVHSDSWGSEDSSYDSLAWDIDAFSWNNPDFLSVFAAGNDGEAGVSTVFAPATAKSTLTVGATLSADGAPLPHPQVNQLGSVYKATISGGLVGGLIHDDQFSVLQSQFGANIAKFVNTDFQLIGADPLNGCTDLVNAPNVKGKVVVMESGACYDVDKLRIAVKAGAAGVLVANSDVNGDYFVLDGPAGLASGTIGIPAAAVPNSVGRIILLSLTLKRPLEIRFSKSTWSPHTYDNIADYSSFGPTLDGRTKPDVVAPGTTASAASGESCGIAVFKGTSMATPIVAGGAVLVRQYFVEGYYPTGTPDASHSYKPSGALVKAVIIAGATPMSGFTETGLPIAPAPSRRQGYGRVTMTQSLPLQGDSHGWRMQVVDGATLSTGESHEYCVRASGGPLRITLVWHDLPSDIAAEKNLVNDLDLSVRAAGLQGMDLFGNGEIDRINNVERVAFESLPSGQVAILVKAHRVFAKYGGQPYALVVHGLFNGELESPDNPVRPYGAASSGTSCSVLVAVVTLGPALVGNDSSPEFSFNTRSGTVPVQGYQCRLLDTSQQSTGTGDAGGWNDCSSPTLYNGIQDGSYTFSVRAKGEEVADSWPFLVDTTPPVINFEQKPPVITSSQNANVEFSVEDVTKINLQCKLLQMSGEADAEVENQSGRVPIGQWTNCTSPQQLSHIGVGNWRFSVQAKDGAGNEVESSVDWLVELDKDKVYTRLMSGPAGPTNGGVIRFEFQALQARGTDADSTEQQAASFECILEKRDGSQWLPAEPFSEGWQSCSSPWQRSNLPDGEYRFSARSLTGSTSEDTKAMSAFSVDSSSPEVAVVAAPSSLQAGRTAKFAFESTEPAITFSCALVSGEDLVRDSDWRTCTSPKVYTVLSDGIYTFYLSGSDDVGNSAPVKKHVFQVDGSSPAIRSVTIPPPSNSTESQVVFVVDDGTDGSGVDNVQCRLAVMCVGAADCDEQRVVARLQNGKTLGHDWRSCGDRVCRRCDDGTMATTSEYVPCLRCTINYSLVEGLFHFSVLAFDRALNSNSPTNYTIVVDKTVPLGAVRSGPSQEDPVPSSVRFTFDLLDGGPGASNVTQILCMLRPKELSTDTIENHEQPNFTKVGTRTKQDVSASSSQFRLMDTANMQGKGEVPLGEWMPCSEPVIYTGLEAQSYDFLLVPIDGAGNRGEVSSPYSFTVDPSLPIPSFSGDLPRSSNNSLNPFLPPGSSIDTNASVGGMAGGSATLVIGITAAIAFVATILIIGFIYWSRRKHRQERDTYRGSGEQGGMPMAANIVDSNGDAPPRTVRDDDEVLRRAIQASLEEQQLAEAYRASLQYAEEELARQQSLETAEQERLRQGISASIDGWFIPHAHRQSSAANSRTAGATGHMPNGSVELPPRQRM